MKNIELSDWEDVKRDNQYSDDDNNGGKVFGLNHLDDDGNVVDVEWFESEAERMACINALEKS